MKTLRIGKELLLKSFRAVLYKILRLRLDRKFRSQSLINHWPPIPLPSINSNQLPVREIEIYVSEYLSLKESVLPFVAETASLRPTSLTLDFGCGFGTLAAAFALSAGKYGEYVGIDSNSQAIEFCSDAYSGDSKFKFGLLERSAESNYVTNSSIRSAKRSFVHRTNSAPTIEEMRAIVGDGRLSCQFSLSVFTHMWPDDSVEALRAFGQFATNETKFINSWLVLDDYAFRQVQQGKADRSLPISVGGIWTYSELNPLLCTAYQIKLMEEIYTGARHRIIDILHGSWAGRGNGVTYQDLVISEKM